MGEQALTFLNYHEQAMASPTLLGWMESDELRQALELQFAAAMAISAVTELLSDDKLRTVVLKAAGKRVAPEIVHPAGLHAIRWLAATLVNNERTPADALSAVLNAIYTRIGKRQGQWLNSLRLIGQRMAGEAYTNGEARFYSRADNRCSGS